MPLDQTELDQIKADAANGIINPLLTSLSGLGLTLRTTADEATYKSTVEGDAIRRREVEVYGNIEAAIKEETGIEKMAGEKATDYLKRATAGIKTELQTLRDKKDDGNASTAEKARIVELEKLVADKDTEVSTKSTEFNKQLLDYKSDTELRVGLAAISSRLKKDLTGDAREDVVEARLARFKREYTPVEEGEGAAAKIVYKKANGEFANDNKGQRLTAEQILSTLFDSYLDKGHKQEGAGTNDKTKKEEGTGNATVDSYAPGSEVKTQSDLVQDLKRQGILKGTEDFTTLFKKHREGLPLK